MHFSIRTEQLHLSWQPSKEKPASPDANITPFLSVRPLRPGVHPAVESRGEPLYEETSYTLFAQAGPGHTVTLHHRDPVLVRSLLSSGDGRVLHGGLNFGSQVGFSRFVVLLDGAPHFAFDVEVIPSKLDYRDDYATLRAEVQDFAAALVFAYLQPTFQPGLASSAHPTGSIAWATLLRHAFGTLERALSHIAAHPGRDATRHRQAVRAEQIRRPDAATRRALLHPTREHRSTLPAYSARYTLDTPEHRWLSTQVRQISARLHALREAETRLYAGRRRSRVLDELSDLHRRANALAVLPPLQAATGTPPPQPSVRLLSAPGYREAYQACLLLQRGLHVGGQPLELGLQDLHLLYEYWCFLTLVRLAADAAGHPLPVHSLLSVEQHGLHLRLRKGHRQSLTLTLPQGRRLTLTYNPRFGGKGYLVPQQPDIMLVLREPGGETRRYILDAKYRLDASPAYRRRFGAPGPPAEALNDLHRYRDAIRDARLRRTVVQAIALFPYREDAAGSFAQSRHYRSLGEVGIGALPLLPGATTYLERWLRTLIAGE